jgi:hypothetical protein
LARLLEGLRYGVLAALALYLCGTALGQRAVPAVAVAGRALVMSDLHFDPMADPKLVDRLAAVEP